MHLEMNKFSLKWKSNILFCQLCRHTFLDCWADPFIPSKKSKTMQQTQKLTTSKTIRFQFEWTVQSGYFGAVNLLALRSNVEHRAPVTHMCSKCETCDVELMKWVTVPRCMTITETEHHPICPNYSRPWSSVFQPLFCFIWARFVRATTRPRASHNSYDTLKHN